MNKISIGLRLGTMLLDHFIICLIGIPPIIIYDSLANPNSAPAEISPYPMIPLFVIYFCKDCIGGRSPAKRILKLVVVDNETNEAATPLQSLIRNFFVLIWPIEVCVTFFNQERRIGDRVAGTKLNIHTTTSASSQTRIGQLLAAISIATVVTLILMKLFTWLLVFP
jgi:uncharacterized RDD family membrane protein YckC